jgi:diacylglycerol kinase (ATP)
MRACVIFNPTARGEKAKRFRQYLDLIAGECILKATRQAGEGRFLAAEAVKEEFATVVAAGGDGTLNEVLNGIGDVPGGFSRTRLAVLPLGTINVFARELGLPQKISEAWEVIRRGRERLIDLPLATFGPPQKRECRYFAQLAGAGLDSRAIELVDWYLKKKIGPLAYVAAGFKALHGPRAALTVSNGNESATGELILIGNGRFYGGNFLLFPNAALDDGQLDVSAFPQINYEHLLRASWGLFADSLHERCGVKQLRETRLTLASTSDLFLQLDGENVGKLPAEITVQKKALRVIVP